MTGRNYFKSIDWFKFRQFMGYAFDLGRIFPIIIKQKVISKLVAGISTHIVEAPLTFWYFLSDLGLQLKNNLMTILPGWISELWIYYLSAFHLKTGI